MPVSVVIEQPEVIEAYYGGLGEVLAQDSGVLSISAEAAAVEECSAVSTIDEIASQHVVIEVWA